MNLIGQRTVKKTGSLGKIGPPIEFEKIGLRVGKKKGGVMGASSIISGQGKKAFFLKIYGGVPKFTIYRIASIGGNQFYAMSTLGGLCEFFFMGFAFLFVCACIYVSIHVWWRRDCKRREKVLSHLGQVIG